jgi:hypothetical protein
MTLGSWLLIELLIDLKETLRGLQRDDDRFQWKIHSLCIWW